MKAIRAKDFVIYEDKIGYDYWANVADQNSLFNHIPGLKGYEDLTDIPVAYLTSTEPSLSKKKTMLTDYLKGSSRTREVDRDHLIWRLKGGGEVRFKSLGNINAGVPNAGSNNIPLYIYGDLEWYVEGDVLAPMGNMGYNVVVQERSEPYGIGVRYNVQVASGSVGPTIPPELLEDGQEWIKIDSTYGEASHGYGSTFMQGTSYTEFEVELGSYGKSVEVTDEAHNLNLRIQFRDDDGARMESIPDRIISMLEAQFMVDIRWEQELRYLIGRSIGKEMIDPSSGYHRKAGPGIFQLMEYGNTFHYNTESGNVIDMFENEFQNYWLDRTDYSHRDVRVATGTAGIRKAQNDMEKKRKNFNVLVTEDYLVKKSAGIPGSHLGGLAFPTFAPLTYNFQPWGSITFEHWPSLDSHYITGNIKHPTNGMPASSYMYIVLDYGAGSGIGNNIELLKRRNSEAFNYICGTWSPVGPLNNVNRKSTMYTASHDGRYYKLTYSNKSGIRIKDVLKTMIFKPSFLQ